MNIIQQVWPVGILAKAEKAPNRDINKQNFSTPTPDYGANHHWDIILGKNISRIDTTLVYKICTYLKSYYAFIILSSQFYDTELCQGNTMGTLQSFCVASTQLDLFTVSLHSTNGRQMPAVRAVQGDCAWIYKNNGNVHWSCEPRRHCDWGIPKLYLDQPIAKGDDSQLVAMSHFALTVLMPLSWDCVAVYNPTVSQAHSTNDLSPFKIWWKFHFALI